MLFLEKHLKEKQKELRIKKKFLALKHTNQKLTTKDAISENRLIKIEENKKELKK